MSKGQSKFRVEKTEQSIDLPFGRVDPIKMDTWLTLLSTRGDRSCLHGYQNLHQQYLAKSNQDLRRFNESADVLILDSAIMLRVIKFAGFKLAREQRFTLMDEFENILRHAEQRGWRVYYLGSNRDCISAAEEKLRSLFPQLEFSVRQGHFDVSGTENLEVIQDINQFSPQLLFVGMGSPRQETWIMDNHSLLQVPHVITAGSTLDYFTGYQPRPPKLLSAYGLAGLYRLLTNPVYTWKRYLLEPWVLLAPYLKWIVTHRRQRH